MSVKSKHKKKENIDAGHIQILTRNRCRILSRDKLNKSLNNICTNACMDILMLKGSHATD